MNMEPSSRIGRKEGTGFPDMSDIGNAISSATGGGDISSKTVKRMLSPKKDMERSIAGTNFYPNPTKGTCKCIFGLVESNGNIILAFTRKLPEFPNNFVYCLRWS